MDITQRKQTEAELQRSEEKYRDLVNALNDGVFVSDDRGVLTFSNQALARMHGFEHPEELVGTPYHRARCAGVEGEYSAGVQRIHSERDDL
jgi:PAS domain S-box-containing protein